MSPIKASEMKIDVSKQDKSGCFQTDLSKAQIKENILKDDDVHSKIQEKFILLHQKLEEDVQKQAAKMDDDITPLITSGLSEQNVQAIRKEYLKDKSKRDIDLIDQLVKKLSFFARFNKDIRINLLKISDLTHYKPATVIFTQEESGDNMYVILRGSVSIEKKAKEFGNQSITVNSLYDGRQFGELSLISSIQSNNQVNARAATCVASEPSEILHIPKVEYNKIILSQLRHDMESKITFLSQLPLFKGLDPILLIPLASNIETTVFDYDEVIIKKGEQPKGLYIIMKGHAAALTEG